MSQRTSHRPTQTNADQHVQHVQHVGSVESVEPTWTKEKHEAFYTFLWNVINPNEMEDYIGMFESKDEPQTKQWHYDEKDRTWYPYSHDCGTCKNSLGDWDGHSLACGRCCGTDYEFYEPKTEPQTIRCPKCGRTDYIRSFEKDFGIKDSGYKYKCINCNTYIKTEQQTERSSE